MPHIFQTFDKNSKPHKRWRFQFIDWTGRKKTATGATTKTKTEDLAVAVQVEQDKIRKLKVKPAPKASDTPRPIGGVVTEYIAWGKSQGGHGNRPWSLEHLEKRKQQLQFWVENLGLQIIQDIELNRVERVLRELQDRGRTPNKNSQRQRNLKKPKPMSGKSLSNYAESLHALCLWAKAREYLDKDPLEHMAGFDTTPRTTRRAATPQEIQKF